MYKKHPVFKEPVNENSKVWKYLDFTKFVSLLDRESLYFARADRLNDSFEGSYPEFNVKHRPQVYKNIPLNVLSGFSGIFEKVRKFTFLNCWHKNEYESAAMWNLYLKSNEGISVQSTFKKLKDSLKQYHKESVFIGEVKYIDYQSQWMPEGNLLYAFVHKRKSFRHEKEIRVLIQRLPISKKKKRINLNKKPILDGFYVPINLKILIEKIYISPSAPKWIFNLAKRVCRKYNFDIKKLKQSNLFDNPVF